MVALFYVEVTGTSREVYPVEAASEEEARRIYESNISSGLLTPMVTEVDGDTIASVKKVED